MFKAEEIERIETKEIRVLEALLITRLHRNTDKSLLGPLSRDLANWNYRNIY